MKLRYIGADDTQVRWGTNDDPRELLTEGAEYTVINEEIHDWHTKIVLAEFPGKKFNRASFEEPKAPEQTQGDRRIQCDIRLPSDAEFCLSMTDKPMYLRCREEHLRDIKQQCETFLAEIEKCAGNSPCEAMKGDNAQ